MSSRLPKQHVIIIDGTQSRLDRGSETNAGLLYKLLIEVSGLTNTTLWYDPGIQGHGFWNWVTIASGWGINETIQNAYAALSNRYEPGDTIFLFGYSRGAFAVRSLSGMIARLGLLRGDHASKEQVIQAFDYYQYGDENEDMAAFRKTYCHDHVEIEMIGVWDTVKALGIDYPVLWRLAPMATEFHNDKIGAPVKVGAHALALDEDRRAYRPVLWEAEPDWQGELDQTWFRGAHADIGGHIRAHPEARHLSNIPLVWMLEKAEKCGLVFPRHWQDRFPQNVSASPVGSRRGIGRFFLLREPRRVGAHPSEHLHTSVQYPIVDGN